MLKPFWRYFGGKWRAAPQYPAPIHDTIVEPFAGAAGYSLRYPDRKVVLIEKYPVIAEVWRYLIRVKPSEVLKIPEVEHVDDLPGWVPAGGRHLVGFALNSGSVAPRNVLSAGRLKMRSLGRIHEGWTPALRGRVAWQVEQIRHWKIIEGDYRAAPNIQATWFIDPPYESVGWHYVHGQIDYPALASWCRTRRGQVLVCEAAGANWLPFRPLGKFRAAMGRSTQEALWQTNCEGTRSHPMVRPMSEKLDALFAEFVARARTILIEEAMASFTAMAAGGGGDIPTPFKAKPGPKPKTAAPAKAAKRAKWQKRSPDELEALTKSLIAHVRKNPGLRSEQIAEALSTTTKDLALPLKALVEAKQLKTAGQRRGTTYQVRG